MGIFGYIHFLVLYGLPFHACSHPFMPKLCLNHAHLKIAEFTFKYKK